MLSSPVSKTDYVYDTPSSKLIPVTTNETMPTQSIPTNRSLSTDDLITDDYTTNTRKLNNENILASSTTKTKPEKSKLFSLKRQKPKPELDKRRGSSDNGLEVSSRSILFSYY
jgi:hypothetical protein